MSNPLDEPLDDTEVHSGEEETNAVAAVTSAGSDDIVVVASKDRAVGGPKDKDKGKGKAKAEADISPAKDRIVSGKWDGAFVDQRAPATSVGSRKSLDVMVPVGGNDIEISIEAHQRLGEGMNAYMAYTIRTRTVLSRFKATNFEVIRRYREFDWLHHRLCDTMPGYIIPPLPDKAPLSNRFSKEFVEMRRRELERFLKRLVSHPALAESVDLQVFLEASDDGLNQHKVESAKPMGSAVWNIGQSLVNAAMYSLPADSDPWYEDKTAYITTLEKQLSGYARSIDRLIRKRREYAAAFSELGTSSRFLGNCETNHQIANVLNSMGGCCERVHALNMDQAHDEVSYFENPMKDYLKTAIAARTMLKNRSNAYIHAHVAAKTAEAKSEKYEKLKGAPGKEAKAQQMQEEYLEAKQAAEKAKEDLAKMNESTKSEIARFERTKVKDIKSSLLRFLQTQIQYETQIQAIWQKLLSEAHNIEDTKQ